MNDLEELLTEIGNIDKEILINCAEKLKTKFGIIFHWGLYSVPAYDSVKSARRRKMQNGSEWYLKRLTETSDYRPISGHKETKIYHEKNFPGLDYYDFPDLFTADNWDPDSWMKFCVSIGASYVILTSRHHDGYCLWPTKTTDFNSVKTGPHRNILKEFKDSAKKFGLKFGIYYSWIEFKQSLTINYLKTTVSNQIDELIEYKPDIFWFDGQWDIKTQFAKGFIKDTNDKIRKKLPNVLINDRIIGKYDFKSFEKQMPESGEKNWEYIDTIGLSWGRNKEQTKNDYKSPQELKELYAKAQKLGASRFTLNMGPDHLGNLDIYEKETLRLLKT